MSGVGHPALAPLFAGGGAPTRLAAGWAEARARLELLLAAPPLRLLDEELLAPLLGHSDPDAVLAGVLGHLDGDLPAEPFTRQLRSAASREESAWRTDRAGKSIEGDASSNRRQAEEIVALARRLSPTAAPDRTKSRSPSRAAAPIEDWLDEPAGARARRLTESADWQREAARSGADMPVRIDPARADPAQAPGEEHEDLVLPADGAVAARASNEWVAPDGLADRQAPGAGPAGDGPQRRGQRPDALPSGTSRQPRGLSAVGARGRTDTRVAANDPASPRSPLQAVSVPDGVPLGGFAGLAALGRATRPEPAVPGEPPAAASPATTARSPGEPPVAAQTPLPADAQTVIAELADLLRLQIRAAGIDPDGRRP